MSNNNSAKILIIASGMKDFGGHNFSYTRAVEKALEEKGFEIEVFANRLLSKDLKSSGYKPIFTHGAYDFPLSKGIKRDIPYIYAQSIIYSDELERELETKLSEYSAIFCHTVGDFELIGWNRFLSRYQLNSKLFILLRGTPNFTQMNPLKRNLHPYLSIKPRYLRAIHTKLKDKFKLVTDSDLLTQDFRSIYKHSILTFPIPINKYFLTTEENRIDSLKNFKHRHNLNKKGICIGYMGGALSAKGFHLLPELVRNILDKRKDVYFAIQCPILGEENNKSNFSQNVQNLYKMREIYKDRLILVSESLDEEEYANMFQCLDIVLIPYLSPFYAESTSGIFAEATALGKPTIVTENTWMSYELRKFGGGLEVQRDNVEDLTQKVFDLINNYNSFAEKTLQYSSKWCEFHNSNKLVEMLIEEIT